MGVRTMCDQCRGCLRTDIFVGGVCYCQCFSAATGLFLNPADKALGATVMNVIYYAGVCLAGGIIVASS